ncbi:MAG: hypothetical protein WDM92_10035 [Caulobacteraceae bacterium]
MDAAAEYSWLTPADRARAEIQEASSFDPGKRQAFAAPAAPAAPAPRAAEPLPGYLDQDAASFFYKWGGSLSATLIRLRARFGGDLDQYVIYLIFVLAELSRPAGHGGRPAAASAPRGLNALSVAEITRIPRETTRRKLQALVVGGYLRRADDGLHYLDQRYGSDEVFLDLKPLFWDAIKVERPA